jgi:hypothetical protein
MKGKLLPILTLGFGLALATQSLLAQESPDDEKAKAAELAKKLSNPIASLISVPIQNNWDFGIGPSDAQRYTANIQPVIPFSLSESWNLITRTIVPVISAQSPSPGGETQSGLGDIVQSFFFSPKAATSGGWIWGAGPVLLYPTATKDSLGADKWGGGPTLVVLKQSRGWTYGALGNHIWSVAGNSDRANVSATFIQPFLSFTTKTFTTIGLNTESTYDWKSKQWTVPLNVSVSQLLKLGKQPVSVGLGYKYFANGPDVSPDWGLRLIVTLLFPK